MKINLKPYLALLLVTLVVGALAFAQEYTEQDAIDFALQIPEVEAVLTERDNWYAKAYDTENKFNVWRVQFYNTDDEDMGFADVSLQDQRVYVYEIYFGATDAQSDIATPIVTEFVQNAPEVLELLPDVATRDMYVDYDGYNNWWGVYIEAGAESLWMTVLYPDNNVTVFDDPRIGKIYFANVKPYDEWFSATSQQAIVVAFADTRVGDALAGKAGWTTSIEHLQRTEWHVDFWVDGALVTAATVDIVSGEVLSVE